MSRAWILLTVALTGCAGGGQHGARDRGPSPDSAFDAGADLAPTPDTLYRLARVLNGQGRESEARYVLQDLIRQHPTFIPAYCDLAELHLRAGQVDAASEVLERGLKVAPKDARLMGNLGMCSTIRGDYEAAVSQFAAAGALGPDDARHRANLAVALGMLGRYDESLAEYQKVIPPASAHYNVAILAKARKDTAKADAEMAQAISMDPSLADEAPRNPAPK